MFAALPTFPSFSSLSLPLLKFHYPSFGVISGRKHRLVWSMHKVCLVIGLLLWLASFRRAVDLFTPAVNLFTPAVDLFTPAVDLFTPAVDLFTPLCLGALRTNTPRQSFGPYFYRAGLFKLVHDVLQFCGPILLGAIVTYVEEKAEVGCRRGSLSGTCRPVVYGCAGALRVSSECGCGGATGIERT